MTRRNPILATCALLGLVACGQPPDEGNVNVLIQGLSDVDNSVALVLWASTDGTDYEFVVDGTAGVTDASFVLTVYLNSSAVVTKSFSLPLEAVNAQPGESGTGSQTETIYPGTTVNNVPITFNWVGNPPPFGQTHVDLSFRHPPRLIDWYTVPGPGAPAGSKIDVEANVEFSGLTRSVTVQFWDDDVGGSGAFIGSPVSLTFTDPLWTGTITAEAGAERLKLIAADEEGTTESYMGFVVAP